MKEKIVQNLLKIVLTGLGIILLWIVITGLVSYDKIIYTFNPIILAFSIIGSIGLMIIIYKKIIPKIEQIKYIEWILFALFTIFAIVIALFLKVSKEAGDMGIVFTLVRDHIEKGSSQNNWYLAMFPNNIMLAVIEKGVLLFARSLGIISDLNVITIFTALTVSSSVIICFFIVKKIYNRRNALMFLIICLFTTPLYMFSALYYTDSFSMPISAMLFYVWLVINETGNTKKKIILNGIYGILLFIGYELKITSIFVFIAIIIYDILNGDLKELFKRMLVIIPVAIICMILFEKLVVNSVAPEEMRYITEVPKEHWVMMGMNEVGNFSLNEYMYTGSFKTYPEKQQAIRKKIFERITQRNIQTHIENLGAKLKFAWHDGTYYAEVKLKKFFASENLVHKVIYSSGQYNKFFKYIPQAMHFSMLTFILINIIKILSQKKYYSKDIICIITIFGIMVFLLIWENRSRYLVNNLLLMIIAEIGGIEYISCKITEFIKQRTKNNIQRKEDG